MGIGEAIRSSYHQSIGHTPYFAAFGQQMIAHGKDYSLFRSLGSPEGEVVTSRDHFNALRQEIQNNNSKAFETSAKRYNLRSRYRPFKLGDIVFGRNFDLSEASRKHCAKFSPKFLKGPIFETKGNHIYGVIDEGTVNKGFYHKKDLKEFPSSVA